MSPPLSSDAVHSQAWKRARLNDGTAMRSTEPGYAGGVDDEEFGGIPELSIQEKEKLLAGEFRSAAVTNLRAVWSKDLNRNRTAIRSFVHTRLMVLCEVIFRAFLVQDNVEKHGWPKAVEFAVADAREHGYHYIFHEENADAELKIPVASNGTRWDIKRPLFGSRAQVYEMAHGVRQGPWWNWNELERMKEKFPCLKFDLRYKQRVLREVRGTFRQTQVAQDRVHA